MPRSSWRGSRSGGLVMVGGELVSADTADSLDRDMLDTRDMPRGGGICTSLV